MTGNSHSKTSRPALCDDNGIGRQFTEVRRQRTGDREQRSDVRCESSPIAGFCPLTSAFCSLYDSGVRRSLEEIDARRLLTGGPITLVTCGYRGRHNIMPVAYAMTASIVPPLIAIAVSPSRYSYDIIHKTEEFALNIPSPALLHHVQYLGSISGVDFDKIELTKLPTTQARRIDTVLLEGCVGWIECGLEEEYEVGDHRLLIGRVVAAAADDEAFNERWLLQ